MRREIGAGVLVAGAAEELFIALEHIEIVRRFVPTWFWASVNHELALALILVGLVLLWRQEREHSQEQEEHSEPPKPASPLTEQQQTSSASASVQGGGVANLKDVGNPRINIFTHPPAPKPQPPKPPPQPKSNISFKNVRTAWIWYNDHDGFFSEVEKPDDSSARGVIARFKNESGAHAAENATYIRAELVFRDVNEQELEQSVHAACWLGERADTVDFRVGEDHWVLLGLFDREDKQQWIVPWKREKTSWEGTWYEIEGHRFSKMRSVEIRLIGELNRWLVKPVVVDIVLNQEEPTVAVRLR